MARAANYGSALSPIIVVAGTAAAAAGVAAGTSQYSGTDAPPSLLAWASRKVLVGNLVMASSWNYQVPYAGYHPWLQIHS